jgi:anti-anti-sigma factor
MKIKETKLGLICILSISGPIVKGHIQTLEESLDNHLNAGDMRLLIDLQEAPLIDSSGLELLWDSLMKFRKVGGSLKLVHASPLIMDIFLATRMTNIFEIFSDQDKAFRSFL